MSRDWNKKNTCPQCQSLNVTQHVTAERVGDGLRMVRQFKCHHCTHQWSTPK